MKIQKSDMIFGMHSVAEALRSGRSIDKIFIQKGLQPTLLLKEIIRLGYQKYASINRVPLEKLNRFTRKNHQGIVAFSSPIDFVSLGNVLPMVYEQGKIPLILILDSITDIRNFGAIIRTAEVLGVDAVVIPTKGAAQINEDAMKTSSGALNYVPICKENNFLHTLNFLKNSGLQIVAATEKADKKLPEIDFTAPTAIIMGSEEKGIKAEILKESNQLVKIPQYGNIESLNVSVATSIVLYEVVRQRNF